jgi:RNA polymerase sigma factor (sigma-70 family)
VSIENLYKQHYPELYRFGYQLCQSVEFSKDLVQNAFIKLTSLDKQKFGVIKNKRAWLYRVLYNDFVTSTRRKEIEYRIGLELSNSRDKLADTQESYDKLEKKQILRKEMKKLPENECALLLLYADGLSYSEISSVLDIKTSSVGSYILRAKKKLLKNLQEKYHGVFE